MYTFCQKGHDYKHFIPLVENISENYFDSINTLN